MKAKAPVAAPTLLLSVDPGLSLAAVIGFWGLLISVKLSLLSTCSGDFMTPELSSLAKSLRKLNAEPMLLIESELAG
jgi:hypothetical protein